MGDMPPNAKSSRGFASSSGFGGGGLVVNGESVHSRVYFVVGTTRGGLANAVAARAMKSKMEIFMFFILFDSGDEPLLDDSGAIDLGVVRVVRFEEEVGGGAELLRVVEPA
jgi:hypothetical protein